MSNIAKLSGIKAVVFDVFGTLVEIDDKRRPFRQLMQLMEKAGRTPKPDDGMKIMSANVGLAGAAQMFGIEIPNNVLAELELELYAELATVKAYPEVKLTLESLRDAGLKIGVCSNLAAPYAVAVKLLLPFELDNYTWSFEVGAVKPEAAIYEALCKGLNYDPHEVVMIGDTLDADYSGPRRFGIHGFHLARREASPASEKLRTLDEILPLIGYQRAH
jgi:HAD superfamily hydrolase (TIGR01549 family)